MTEPYLGEIRIFGGNFAPRGWAFCDGQIMSIADNDALYNLVGTVYGGDGISTFGLPDLRGRAPVHMGTSAGQTYVIGEKAGVETVTLIPQQIPAHTHTLLATSDVGSASTPGNATFFANTGPAGVVVPSYVPFDGANQVALNPASVGPAGGNQPHDNMQPYLGLNFIIALAGIFPSQN